MNGRPQVTLTSAELEALKSRGSINCDGVEINFLPRPEGRSFFYSEKIGLETIDNRIMLNCRADDPTKNLHNSGTMQKHSIRMLRKQVKKER